LWVANEGERDGRSDGKWGWLFRGYIPSTVELEMKTNRLIRRRFLILVGLVSGSGAFLKNLGNDHVAMVVSTEPPGRGHKIFQENKMVSAPPKATNAAAELPKLHLITRVRSKVK